MPEIRVDKGSRWRSLVAEIEDAAGSGALTPGQRLPSQRRLARLLGWSPATVVRAYEELARRGLVQRHVGRGTFVAAEAVPTSSGRAASFDLASNVAPFPETTEAKELLTTTLEALSFVHGPEYLLSAERVRESASGRASGARWLARCGLSVSPERVELVCGSQHGLAVALGSICEPGDVVAAASLSNPGLRLAAAHYRLGLAPVSCDEGGLLPEALERLCRRRKPKALYCSPTVHNPTGATLSAQRRGEVAEIAERHGLVIIEDDDYGPIVPDRPPPLARLAPQRTIYLGSLSKCFGFGFRLGLVCAPATLQQAVRAGLRATIWMAPPLLVAVASAWIDGGSADRFVTLRRNESRRRMGLAKQLLRQSGADVVYPAGGYHLWISLRPPLTDSGIAAAAERRGVRLTPASEFHLGNGGTPRGCRLALGAETMERLAAGLRVVNELLAERNHG